MDQPAKGEAAMRDDSQDAGHIASMGGKGYRGLVLALLLAVYVLNFVDRQIVGILVEPIKADLKLDDAQIGLMGGFAFAVLYTTLGIPLAWAADRFNRVWIITASLAVWSAMTALCGTAQNFTQLLLARVMVGVGEAGGSPPSQSIISDYFPPHERPRALGIWALGIPIGSATGVLIGAFVATYYGWRAAFLAAGVPGFVLAMVLIFVVREPPRGRFDPPAVGNQPSLWKTLGALASRPTFILLTLGAAFASFAGYALFFWGAAYFVRAFGLSLPSISLFTALVIGISASLGTFFGGALAAKLGVKDARYLALIPALGLLLAAPLHATGALLPNALIAGIIILIPAFLAAMWYGPVFGAVQNLVEPRMRATAVAVMYFVINIIGLGGGPTITGMVSNHFSESLGPANALRVALLFAIGVQALAGLVMASAALTIRADYAKSRA